jgi:hypothetical protein
MVCADDIFFNGLMGRLGVPYRYHKTLHGAVRNQMTIPSANLADWLPIENADEVWRQVRTLMNVPSHLISVDERRPLLAPPGGPATPVLDSRSHSDPSIKLTPLPGDHPTHMLEESRRYYQKQLEDMSIPFLVNKRSKEKFRTVIIATSDKRRPNVPLKAQIQLREWDTKHAFWTMDINNTRYIVKSKGGAANGGSKYDYWAGPVQKFKGPIAFSENSATRSSCKTPFTEYIEIPSDAEDLPEEQITHGTRSDRYFKEEGDDLDVSALLRAESTCLPNSQEKADSVVRWPFPNADEQRPVKAEHASSRQSETVSGADSPETNYSSHVPRTVRSLQPLPAKRRKTGTTSDLFDRVDQGSLEPNAQPISSLTARPSRSSQPGEAAQAPSPLLSHTTLVSGSSALVRPGLNAQQSSPFAERRPTPEDAAQGSSSFVPQMNLASGSLGSISRALSREKQENTILQVRLEEDGFNRVKKFRSCSTVSEFFTLIAKIWRMRGDDFWRAEVTIGGTQESERRYKMELMPDDDEDCMEVLIGKIEAWPLEKGYCNIDVVVYRHGCQVSRLVSIV